jgi:hypothetical protein
MKFSNSSHSARVRRKDGMAVIVMLALLAMILGFIVANSRVLANLGGEIKVIEQKQIRRLNHSANNMQRPAMAATAQAAQPVAP